MNSFGTRGHLLRSWGGLPLAGLALAILLTCPLAFAESPSCVPACRGGYTCVAGACVSACNPACPSDEVCVGSGRCVSACNPPCAAGETCTSQGQCLAAAQPAPRAAAPAPTYPPPAAAPAYPPQAAAPAPAYPAQAAPPAPGAPAPGAPAPAYGAPAPAYGSPTQAPAWGAQPGPPPDAGWARGAAVFGYLSAAVIVAGTIGSMANNETSTADTARNIGGATTLYAAVAIPIIAVGGGSARENPQVHGSRALRIVSWIGYGVTLADASVLIAIPFSTPVDNGQIASVGALGAVTALGFAVDASTSAGEADALRDRMARPSAAAPFVVTPSLGAARAVTGQVVPTYGLAGTF